ncbi:MAG: SAM-dependent chlorinase/fluorinase [Patescibacteria group bacterium]
MSINKGSLGIAQDDKQVLPVVTLTCDFGDNFAAAQMELVAYGIAPKNRFILVSNEVHEYSIVEGAFIMEKSCVFAPKGSVHIGVVDPGVGSERRGIVIKSKNYWFVGPDNGLLYPAAKSDGIEKVYEINSEKLGNVTNTFHGRDVFAKVAALIVSGADVIESKIITESKSDIVALNFQNNQVVHIDPYGNVKVNKKVINEKTIKLKKKNNYFQVPVVKTFADVDLGELLVYSGSHGTLEIAVNQGSASNHLDIRLGEVLEMEYK